MDEPTGSFGGAWPTVARRWAPTTIDGAGAIYAESNATPNLLQPGNSSCMIADGN